MAQYIDKDVLMAEIENRLENEEVDYNPDSPVWALLQGYKNIKDFISTLEVKEVDLEKEIEMIRKHYFVNNDFDKREIDGRDITNIAKHFFELGLKVEQKGKNE